MIDILIPTRGRPERLRDSIYSALKTAKGNDFHFYLYLDSTDNVESYKPYIDYEHITYAIGQSETLSKLWNVCYFMGQGEILFHGSDDMIFETHGWDEIVIEHFYKSPDSMLYGKDGHQDKNCATWSFTSRRNADILGYFCPPFFEADFNDLWLMEVYKGIGRLHYNPALVIRHNHRNADIKFDDETYRIAEERRVRSAKVWEEKNYLISGDIEKIRENL